MRTLARILALLAAATLFTSAARAEDRPRVVIVRTLALDQFAQAEAALVDALGNDVELLSLDVQPSNRAAPEQLRLLEPDVVVPIGTQATAWAAKAIQDTPIVFSMVLDPVAGGLVRSFAEPRGHITGAALDIPFAQQFSVARRVLAARRVAVLYNPEHSGRSVEAARKAASAAGIELVGIPVESRSHFESALRQVDHSFDALWSVPDPTVFSKRLAQRILLYTIRRRIPMIGLSEQHVRAGALYSLVSSFEENGRQAAELVREVLDGREPGQIPVRTPEDLRVVVNPRTAESLRITPAKIGLVDARFVR